MRKTSVALAALLACSAMETSVFHQSARAQPASTRANANVMSTLDGLTKPRDGKTIAYTSHARDGSNVDFRPIAPGQTFTLMDHRGAGTIRRFWYVTAPFNNVRLNRQLILRCYWDGETTPSVEAPIADFFGGSFGEWKQYVSLPLNMTSGGSNSYWAMPFRRGARITVENRSDVPISHFYYNIAMETTPVLPRETLYFHAQFRRQKPSRRGQPVTLLEARGRGHYVGTLVSMQPLIGRTLSYLEGDEIATVDGERTPSVIGTGTEDYFSGAYYFATGEYSAPYHGLPRKDEATGRVTAYRWHIEDPIPFSRSLRFDLEHGGANDAPFVDYTSVAYWYQTHPRAPFPALPRDLLPSQSVATPKIAGIIEGESLQPTARASEGDLLVQDLATFAFPDAASLQAPLPPDKTWSDLGHLFWQPKNAGARLTLQLNAPENQSYELVGYFTRAPDYGDLRVLVNGTAVGETFRGYNNGVVASGAISFGQVPMKAGANEVVLEVVGKDARSGGYYAGLDGFLLR